MYFGHNTFLALLQVCQFIGLTLFLRGFFPIKKAIQGTATNENLPSEPSMNTTGRAMVPKFGRVVIVLIDALRADFVFNERSTMPFTQDLIERNKTLSYLAKAHPPTVTMPRIKALTTGSIPGFVDVVLNLDSKSLQEDNIISQMKFANKKLVFYGDDTWMKLFPDHFLRTDGTTSFFVTDYTEVDNNVTRHLDKELQNEDWDTMILHYLGLDHIGHIAGPSSPLVGPKLKEMDQILKRIYTSFSRWDKHRGEPSLMVLCGDHGMSDAGSHGGASSAETSTPLVFMSPLFEHQEDNSFSGKQVKQIDLAPTLSLLLGLPIPQNSIGMAIADLFQFLGPRGMLRALQLNSHQLSQVLRANGHTVDDIWEVQQAYKLHSDWLKSAEASQTANYPSILAGKVAKQYIVALQEMTGRVTASLSNYDLHAMIWGIAVLVQTLFWVVHGLLQLSVHQKTRENQPELSMSYIFVTSGAVLFVVILHLCACSSTILGGSDIVCSSSSAESLFLNFVMILLSGVTLGSVVLCSFSNSPTLIASLHLHPLLHNATVKLLAMGVLWHTLSLLSSSFVEEEHQTWYFLTSTYFVFFFFNKMTLFYQVQESKEQAQKENCPERFESKENNLTRKTMERGFLNHVPKYANSQLNGVEDFTYNIAAKYDLQMLQENATIVNEMSKVISKQNEGHTSDRTTKTISPRELLCCALLSLVLLCCGRLSRAWNQTGMKWSDRPDIGDYLVKPENKTGLSLLFLVSLLIIIIFRFSRHNRITSLVFLVGASSAYLYRAVTGSLALLWMPSAPITKGIAETRCTYCCVVIMLIWSIVNYFKPQSRIDNNRTKRYFSKLRGSLEILLSSLLLLEVLLQRPHNVALLAVFVFQEHFFRRLVWQNQQRSWIIILSSLWMGHAMYFSQGNSNSLATVDIAAGYVGLTDHVPSVVGPLMCLATYCGPLLWLLAAVLYLVQNATNSINLQHSLHHSCYVVTLCQSLVLCVYCMLVFGQRYHLFVWTVFSPKLLYEVVRTLVLSTSVFLVLGLGSLAARTRNYDHRKRHVQ